MTFYNDSFHDAANTPLTGSTGHVSDSGATYTFHPAYPASLAIEIAAGIRMRGNRNANVHNVFNISQAAPSSDHSMTCKVYIASTLSGEEIGVICRVTKTGNGYWYSLTINNGNVHLFKNLNNVYMQLGANVSISETAGASFNLTLSCQGSLITGTVTRDFDGYYLTSTGAWQAAPVNVFSFVDTSVPLTSNVGVWIGSITGESDTVGYQMASASGANAPVPALVPTALPVLDAKAGFGAQGLVRNSVTDGSISGNTNTLTCSTSHQFQSTDVGLDICVVNGTSGPPASNTAFLPPPAAPTLSACCGTLPATTYYVVVSLVSATGETIASPESSITVTAPNTLLAVQQPPTSGTGWNVYAAAQLQTPGAPSLTSCCCGGSLLANSTYRYKITAVDIHHPITGSPAESAASSEASVATSGGANTYQITASWTAVTGAVAYNIYRSAANGLVNSETYLIQVPGNFTSFTDTGAIAPAGPSAPTSDTGTGTGREIRQNANPLPFTGPWIELTTGLTTTGAGALITKIKTVSPPNQVTLNYSWPFTPSPSSLTATWGIDDTTPLQAAITASRNGPSRATVYLPAAQYMITRKLIIGDPVYGTGAAGLIIRGDGNFDPDYTHLPGGYPLVSCKSVIVWAGPANQPMLEVFNAINLSFGDFSLWGPTNQAANLSYGAPAAGIQLITTLGWYSGDIVIDNVTIGLCSIGLLMEYGTLANADITANFLVLTNCINFGLRDLCTNGLNYWMRSLYVTSDATNNPTFVAAQFDWGGWLYWLGGGLTSVPTVLKITNSGAGDNAANFVLDGLRIDSSVSNQRCTIVDTLNAGAGIGGTNTIAVNNTQLNSGIGDGSNPLFRLGPNTNVTVRSSTLFKAPIATMVSSAAGDTTLVLENVNYAAQAPFAAVITADAGSYWRSRNCRINSMLRFDESNWAGDGVVAPFRNNCLGLLDSNSNALCRGYFRPGNRRQNRIANEFPFHPTGNSQLVYGTCTGVFRNNPSGSPPVIPAVPEDEYPGWFDGNSYITMDHGPSGALFDTPLGNNPCTSLAFVRFPSSALNRPNPIYSNLNLTLAAGMSLRIDTYMPGSTTYYNVPMFQVSTAAGLAPLTDMSGAGISISADTWYLVAGVKDIVFNKLRIYLFGPGGLALTSSVPHVQYVSNGMNNRCIGRDEATNTNIVGYIELFALFAAALTQAQLQSLYNVGINGG